MSYAEANTLLEAHERAVEVAQKLLAHAKTAKAEEREEAIGQALYQLQAYEAASEHLLASSKLKGTAESAARLAVCYWRMNNLDAAKQWIHRALAMDAKGSLTTHIAQTKPTFLALLAQFHLSAGEMDEASEAATAALKVDAKDVAALHVQAITQLASGKEQDALKSFDDAIKAAPPFVAARLKEEQTSVANLRGASLRLKPFVNRLDGIGRVIV